MSVDQSFPPPPSTRVNFFCPRPGFMRQGVRFIWAMLAGWALLTFGFQALLTLTQTGSSGQGPITDATLFGFPFHFWFTGQFLVLWFIGLCFVFNSFIDRLTARHRKQR